MIKTKIVKIFLEKEEKEGKKRREEKREKKRKEINTPYVNK